MHKTKQNACTMQCIDCILHARWNMFCFVLSGTCMQNKTEHIFECMRYTINALHRACACVLFVLCKVGRACRTKHMLPCMYACDKQSKRAWVCVLSCFVQGEHICRMHWFLWNVHAKQYRTLHACSRQSCNALHLLHAPCMHSVLFCMHVLHK